MNKMIKHIFYTRHGKDSVPEVLWLFICPQVRNKRTKTESLPLSLSQRKIHFRKLNVWTQNSAGTVCTVAETFTSVSGERFSHSLRVTFLCTVMTLTRGLAGRMVANWWLRQYEAPACIRTEAH